MFKIFKLNQRGVLHLIPLFILLIGIVTSVYLVQKQGFQIFKPKATGLPQIEFQPASGNDTLGSPCRVYEENGMKKTNCQKVNLKFNTPNENQTYDMSLVKTAYASHGPNTEDWYCEGNKIKQSEKYGDTFYEKAWAYIGNFHNTIEDCNSIIGNNSLLQVCREDKSPPGNSANDVVCVDRVIDLPIGNAAVPQLPASIQGGAGERPEQPEPDKSYCDGNTLVIQESGSIRKIDCSTEGTNYKCIPQSTRIAVCLPPGATDDQDTPEGGDCVYPEGTKCYLGSYRSSVCKYDDKKGVHEYNCQTGVAINQVPGRPAVVNPPASQPVGGAPASAGTQVGTCQGAPIIQKPDGSKVVDAPCGDNPPVCGGIGERLEGYRWKADCASTCSENKDCRESTSGYVNAKTSNWCYGFKSGNRCLMLEYEGEPSRASAPTSTPIPRAQTTPTPTPTAAPAGARKTDFFRFAENIVDLHSPANEWKRYTPGVIVVDYDLKTPGVKQFFVEFKYSDGVESSVYALNYIEYVQPATAAEVTGLCSSITAQNAAVGSATYATANFNSTSTNRPTELKLWISSNNDINRGAVDVGSWTPVKTVSNPQSGSRINFDIPSGSTGLTPGTHAVLMTLHGASGLMDGNPGGRVNPNCATNINITAAIERIDESRANTGGSGGSCVPTVTECGCGNTLISGRGNEDAGRCYPECNGGWCKGNPSSSLGGKCETCSP